MKINQLVLTAAIAVFVLPAIAQNTTVNTVTNTVTNAVGTATGNAVAAGKAAVVDRVANAMAPRGAGIVSDPRDESGRAAVEKAQAVATTYRHGPKKQVVHHANGKKHHGKTHHVRSRSGHVVRHAQYSQSVNQVKSVPQAVQPVLSPVLPQEAAKAIEGRPVLAPIVVPPAVKHHYQSDLYHGA